MALPLLPAEHIRASFDFLERHVRDQPVLTSLCTYLREKWIDSTVWPIQDWSVYRKSIRTNNEVEGWHTRMNVDKAQVLNNYRLLHFCINLFISHVDLHTFLFLFSFSGSRQRELIHPTWSSPQ